MSREHAGVSAAVLGAAALFLDYPSAETAPDLALVSEVLRRLPRRGPVARLRTFNDWWSALPPAEREMLYVETFDMRADTSLYLFSSDARSDGRQGRALLALRETYRRHGFEPVANELPDYLPLVLEFAARADEGRRILGAHASPLRELRQSLERIGSPFAEVVSAILGADKRRWPWP